MRFSFEGAIRDYRNLAEDARSELTAQEEERLEAATEYHLRRNASIRETDQEVQEEIFAIQKRKQEIMAKLKERIASLGTEDEQKQRPDERLVQQVDGRFVVRGEGMRPDLIATTGELITDMDWGVYYHLDPDTVERNVRKRYLIEDARQELHRLLDQQITIDETASERTSPWLRDAFQKRTENSQEKTGFLAERMTKGFLRKLSYDHDVDFEVHEADAFQDVVQKMDFIVQRRKHERGVQVEESDRVGVQFTVNQDPEVLAHKREQVERSSAKLQAYGEKIQDVVLVQVPADEVRTSYDAWIDADKPPGGPEKLWSEQTQETVFTGVMEGMLGDKESVAEEWQGLKGLQEQAQAAVA